MNIRRFLEYVWRRGVGLVTRRYYARISKKWTAVRGRVTAHGESIRTRMPINDDGTVDYTLDDLGKYAIQCAWCARAIFIGDPVTLYVPNPGWEVPEYVVRYDEDPRALVGCLRWDCADTGADRSGYWMPHPTERRGRVERVLSPLEMLMISPEKGAVIVSDFMDRSEAVPFPKERQ